MIASNKTLIVLLGPTGIGKTELSLELAQRLKSVIISCDSRQFYQELSIGTASPTKEQLGRVPHYFIGSHTIHTPYNAGLYEQEALLLIEELFEHHDYLILTGGSMMYMDAICKGIDDIPNIDPVLRANLTTRLEEEGLEPLLQELKLLDPEYYNQVDRHNYKRVLHGLEVCLMSGRPYTSFRTANPKQRPFSILKIGLHREREELYRRINERVNQMMSDGLLSEATSLYPYRTLNALNTVGYKELFSYLDGTYDLETAVAKIKQNSRIYSRKQMTWFRRDHSIQWFHPDQLEQIATHILTHQPICE